jgi:hypothetical protein
VSLIGDFTIPCLMLPDVTFHTQAVPSAKSIFAEHLGERLD